MKFISKGFTLIELLLVIAIIGLLSSTTFAFLQTARAKATNSAQQQTTRSVSTALASMIAEKGNAPLNYGAGSYADTVAWSDAPKTLDGNTKNAFDKSMDELIAAGYLKQTPKPVRSDLAIGYYNYGKGSPAGAVVYARLATIGALGTGYTQPTVTAGNNACQVGNASIPIYRTSGPWVPPIVPSVCPAGFRSYAEYTKADTIICYNDQAVGTPANPTVSGGGYGVAGCFKYPFASVLSCESYCQGDTCQPYVSGGGGFSIPVTLLTGMTNETACTASDTGTACRCNPI